MIGEKFRDAIKETVITRFVQSLQERQPQRDEL